MKLDLKNKLKNLDLKNKYKNFMLKKNSKKILALALILIVIVGFFGGKALLGSKTKVNQNTATVKKGNLNVTVTGSSAIYSSNESKLYSQIGAKITKVNYKEGDVVKAGDIIALFDDSDYQTSLANSENSLEQSQISTASSYEDASNLTIKAPFSGQVSNITVNAGDSVQNGGAVLTISDTSKLKLLLTYNATDASKIAIGQTADVYLTSLMQSVSGTVTYVSNQAATTASGGLLYTVEIRLDNPGAITEGTVASADINTSSGTVSSTNSSTLSYINKKVVTSITGGTVQSISVNENQKVSQGQVLMVMKNNNISRAKDTADLKMQLAQSQMQSSVKQGSKYQIVAPYDGTITKIYFKEGDTVTAGAEIADITNPAAMQFDVSVDELDIAKIAVGQKVNITLDAISSTATTPMVGEVIKVAFTGTSSNGVTTYPVTIKFDSDVSALKSGMNANAEIMVNSYENVLYVPIEAVSTVGNKKFVWVKQNGSTAYTKTQKSNTAWGTNTTTRSNSTSKSGTYATSSYYAGAVRTEVTVGDNTSTYIVINSGLKEGDVIVLPQTKAASNTTTKSSIGTGSIRSSGNGGGNIGVPGGGM